MSTSNDLIVPPPIPFADESVGELEEAAQIFGTSLSDLKQSVSEGPVNARPNPALAYDRFLVPTADILVSFSKLDHAAYLTAEAETNREVLKSLDLLEQAVMDEDYKILTKSGKPGGTQYLKGIQKMRQWLADPIRNKPPFSIFMKGNKKLPFWAFSTLPGATCPGAGACLKNPETGKRGWCYSFSAWRNITPYFRQLQNTILIRMRDKSWIEAEAKEKFKPGQVVRLYVDGDFDSMETLSYWMHFCDRHPQNQFYGYSKSWAFFKQWHKDHNGEWPENYLLNLSSGTKLESVLSPEKFKDYVRSMLELRNPKTGRPVVRGTFRALEVSSKYPKQTEEESKKGVRSKTMQEYLNHRKDVEATAKRLGIKGDTGSKGIFVCPGYCGSCLPGGKHACGDIRFRDFAIVIGIH